MHNLIWFLKSLFVPSFKLQYSLIWDHQGKRSEKNSFFWNALTNFSIILFCFFCSELTTINKTDRSEKRNTMCFAHILNTLKVSFHSNMFCFCLFIQFKRLSSLKLCSTKTLPSAKQKFEPNRTLYFFKILYINLEKQ